MLLCHHSQAISTFNYATSGALRCRWGYREKSRPLGPEEGYGGLKITKLIQDPGPLSRGAEVPVLAMWSKEMVASIKALEGVQFPKPLKG